MKVFVHRRASRARISVSALSALALSLAAGNAAAQPSRIMARPARVTMHDVVPGEALALRVATGRGYIIENSSTETLHMRVTVEKPAKHDVKTGMAPIPDTSWVEVEPSRFIVPRRGSVEPTIVVTVPEAGSYAGGRYVAFIRATTAGRRHNVSLVSELHFIVADTGADEVDDSEL